MMTYRRIKGWGDRVEELLESLPSSTHLSGVTLFFGGDIQDFRERMLPRPQSKKYAQEESLEAVCSVLRTVYEEDRIWMVRPSELFDGIYSRFSNWVDCNAQGNPSGKSSDYKSLVHLEELLKGGGNDNSEPIRLIGFSKGCVVLNQLLYELSLHKYPFTSRIVSMLWLDGGHGGKKNTWVTDLEVLKSFRRNCPTVDVDVRVTPYQVFDTLKPWVAAEEEIFTSVLESYGRFFRRKLYFENDPSLEAHFRVIRTLINEGT